MKYPLVSIYIPTFNAEDFIEGTIESVFSQNYPNLEVIIVDNNSTDGTYSKINEIRKKHPNIVIFQNDLNIGPRKNWNKSLSMTNGTLVKLLCADDQLRPNCIIKQVEFLEKNLDHVLVCGHRDIVNKFNKTLIADYGLPIHNKYHLSLDRESAIYTFLKYGSNPFGEPSAVMMRRSILTQVGGWSQRWDYMIDMATYLEVLRYGKIGILNQTVSTFRISKKSWSHSLFNQQAIEVHQFIDEIASEVNLGSVPKSKAKIIASIKASFRKIIFSFS